MKRRKSSRLRVQNCITIDCPKSSIALRENVGSVHRWQLEILQSLPARVTPRRLRTQTSRRHRVISVWFGEHHENASSRREKGSWQGRGRSWRRKDIAGNLRRASRLPMCSVGLSRVGHHMTEEGQTEEQTFLSPSRGRGPLGRACPPRLRCFLPHPSMLAMPCHPPQCRLLRPRAPLHSSAAWRKHQDPVADCHRPNQKKQHGGSTTSCPHTNVFFVAVSNDRRSSNVSLVH